jgi:hypothetical protein
MSVFSDDGEACINITNDPELYFPDGNLVILTRDEAGNHTYFRVHQSILSKHSQALSDHMFPTSSPNFREIHDGVPLVEFQEDARDLNIFLKFLYEPL